MEKSGGVVEGEGECGDDLVWLLSSVKPIISVGHTDNRISYQCATLI